MRRDRERHSVSHTRASSDRQRQAESPTNDSDEEVSTFLSVISNTKATVMVSKAHTDYWAMLSNIQTDLCIPDGGADSHVGGKAWLPLTALSGPGVRYANVTGFDEHAAKKYGYPLSKQPPRQF